MAVAIGIALAIGLWACTSVTVPLDTHGDAAGLQGKRIVGVTTVAGDYVQFDREPAAVIVIPDHAEGPEVIRASLEGA